MKKNHREKLLIVDDELRVRQYLATVCRRLGFHVATASDRESFERQLIASSPSVILLDLQMPGEDGIKVLKMLNDHGSGARIILVSGMDERTLATTLQVGRSMGLDMDGALTKPVLIETLRAKLAGATSKRTGIRVDELEQAIAAGEIRPAFQPKAVRGSNGTWAVTEAEALARWQRSDSSIVFPSEFLGVAERSGLLSAMTRSLLEQVVAQLQLWERRGLCLSAAVNLSPSTLTDSTLPDYLSSLMQKHGLGTSRLTLELTESAAVQNQSLAMEILSRLRILGFGLSIDDFGTGYSSLEQLYRMPFNELKIDRFLVREIGVRREAEVIIETIISLGQKLNLDVCAEGVESRGVVEFLCAAGCDKLQGFYIGRPASPGALLYRAREFEQCGFEPVMTQSCYRQREMPLPAPMRYQ